MNTFQIAFRNLRRNRTRTSISIATIGIATAVLILSNALTLGMVDDASRNVIDLGVGEAQVHAPGYLVEQSIHDSLKDPDAVLARARERGVAAAPRALAGGLLAAGDKSAGLRFWGIDPAAERELGKLPRHLRSGQFLPDTPDRRVVLGGGLARALAVGVGAEVAMVVQGLDGSVSTELLRVSGVLDNVGEAIDRGTALIDRRDFEQIFSAPGKVHEIALSTHGRMSADDLVATMSGASPGAEVKSWRALKPAVASVVDIWEGSTLILAVIFFLAAGLGVLNTMLMASYERIPEFGTIKALGATPGRIVRDVAAEAFVLAALSTALGAALGTGLAWLAETRGLDLSVLGTRFSFSGVTLQSVWRAKLTPSGVYGPVVLMLGVAVAAALYPAIKAARLDPVKALVHV
uniref:ABC transporter permease n=1 Tax=Sorangium cellulosum TaxID=56 RepID=A0A0M4KNU2_SORCE|nr:ABC transporter permease [Sorangium cellulosum]